MAPTGDPMLWSAADAAAWLEENYPDAADKAREADVTGSVLCGMPEEELKEVLGLSLIARRKVGGKLKALHEVAKARAAAAKRAAGPPLARILAEEGGKANERNLKAYEEAQKNEALNKDKIDDQLLEEQAVCGPCKWAVGKLHDAVAKAGSAWAKAEIREAKRAELQALGFDEPPGYSIVLVGDTGAGKSTLLNAALGEAAVLPTSGYRACTSAIIEMRHCGEDDEGGTRANQYRAEIDFMDSDEWADELDNCLDILTTQDGRAILNVGDSNNPAYDSFCKLRSVYGREYTSSRVASGQRNSDNRMITENMLVRDLRTKLNACRGITHALGTSKRLVCTSATELRAAVERFVDSTGDVSVGSFWPIVKLVKLWGPWDVLKTGAVMVDAPGVNDENATRDAIVQCHLRDADSIWICADITRAQNNKTAKDMLGQRFRQQLLMDDQVGSLVFVATRSDNLNRDELVHNLQLPADSTTEEVASARNARVRSGIQKDFIDGLVEVGEAAGERPDRAALARRFQLPIFCTSSVDFQKAAKIVPLSDGPPRVWTSNIEGTELPQLRNFVHRAAMSNRGAKTSAMVKRLLSSIEQLTSFLGDAGTASAARRDAARQAFEGKAGQLKDMIAAETDSFAHNLDAKVAELKPKLKAGAATATDACVEKMEKYGKGYRQGGLHWATYKATCRRHGEWRVNMNEELAMPVFERITAEWDRIMNIGFKQYLSDIEKSLLASFELWLDTVEKALVEEAGADRGRLGALRAPQVAAAKEKLKSAVADAGNAARTAQRESSRTITPQVKEEMVAGYDAAAAEAGTGSHKRRTAKLEAYVRDKRKTIFAGAAKVVEGKVGEIVPGIKKSISGAAGTLLPSARVNYSTLWEEPSAQVSAARAALLKDVTPVRLEVQKALWKLQEAQGETIVRPDVDDDDLQVIDGPAAACGSGGAGGGDQGAGGGVEDHEMIDLGDSDDDGAEAGRRAREAAAAKGKGKAKAIKRERAPLVPTAAGQGGGRGSFVRVKGGASGSAAGGASPSVAKRAKLEQH